MEAGRELDKLIAEKVFGLRVEVTQEETSGFDPNARWVGGGDYYECDVHWAIPPDKYEAWASGEAHDDDWYLAPYSTEIVWAWQVLMTFRSWRISTSERNVHKYNCTVWGEGITPRSGSAYNEATPELAICKAALAAFEEPQAPTPPSAGRAAEEN